MKTISSEATKIFILKSMWLKKKLIRFSLTGNYPSGIYLVVVRGTDGIITQQKLILE